MKSILGLDLGTTSIGWAIVNEAENDNEKSSIIKTGVRVIPLSTDEATDFNKGKTITINADRTLKRGARRSLQRYKLRRNNLISILKEHNILSDNSILSEYGNKSTFETWGIRANAAKQEVSLSDFTRVLLALNKKRGYKSNRKTKDEGDGQAIDGMEIAKHLYENKLTPGQYVLSLLELNKKSIPDFYRSDLQAEFDAVWGKQKAFYPNILTNELKENLRNKNKGQTWKICEEPFAIQGITLEGTAKEKKIKIFQLRGEALNSQVTLEHLAIILQEINNQLFQSSGYLGAISDRSKELYFKNLTVGEYLHQQIQKNPHTRLKNQVFYRQDYLDEFEQIWEIQSKKRKDVLTDDLKREIRDVVIFYQRRLKSQKGLINVCEFEGKEREINLAGNVKKKFIGPRVIPKSSLLFQEFKIWQNLNNLKFEHLEQRTTHEISNLDESNEIREILFNELNVKGKLSGAELLKFTVNKPKEWELKNFKDVQGNTTFFKLYEAFEKIINLSGHDIVFKSLPAAKIKKTCQEVFTTLGINTNILDFDSDCDISEFEKQASFQLWHLLYSYEGDNSKTGNEKLFKHLKNKFGFEKEYAQILANITFQEDYGSLSAKAIRKILPYLKTGHEFSAAASLAGYNHSNAITSEENSKRTLMDSLELLPKNSIRNPVVEKILNQMVNVVNAIIQEFGKPDEIRIELARELKKSAKERADMTSSIAASVREYDGYREEIASLPPFNRGVRITKNDLIKYRLWKELESTGYKTIYTNTYVPLDKLFSKEFDIEHIIPKAVLFDDSFSNKTISIREFNRWKSSKTGYDAVTEKFGKDSDACADYVDRVEYLFKNKKISKGKRNKLLMTSNDIPDGFIDRDLRNSQYIAKKATEMLFSVVRKVTTTTGSVTDKLREDWQLINVLQELNWEKYTKLGLTYYEKNKDNKDIPKIKDWTKRNDHRHHAMDALTVAFTKPSHIQYLNYLNARRDENHKKHSNIFAIQEKETFLNEKNKRLIKAPMPIQELRDEAKKHLENTLISFKAKNKVVTRNINKTKKEKGQNTQLVLTPRGQLHKETIYGSSNIYVTKLEKVGVKFTEKMIALVAKKSFREALLKRLQEFDNDPKKAFTGKNTLAKNPIYLDAQQNEVLPEKVTIVWQEKRYTIRKEVAPDLKIDKVLDMGIKKILQARLDDFGGDPKKAFVNLEEDPIWLNEEKGIQIKRVAISGVSNAEALHTKKDHFGNEILDTDGKPIPNDFVSTGNNHHVAIYKDDKGKLQEKVVSFYEAVMAKNVGLSVIDKTYNQHLGWEFLFTMKQNEYFVFPNEITGFNPSEIDLTLKDNYLLISPNLYRVQKITSKDYFFRHHLETTVDNIKETKNITWKREGISGIIGILKVRINHLGQIVKVGE